MTKPRTTEHVLAHADELAARFEAHDPDPANINDAAALRALRVVHQAGGEEHELRDAVSVARADGHSWAAIAAMLGMDSYAAHHQFGGAGFEPT